MAKNPLDYLGVPDATTAIIGAVELATTAETTAGTNATKAVTPAGVAAVAIAGAADASEGTKGIAQLSTSAQATTGTNDLTIMTPLKVANKFAAPGAIGGTTAAAGTFTSLDADGTGAVTLVGNAASLFDVTGAGIDLTLSSDAGRVVINAEEAAADALRISSAAGGLDLDVALGLDLVCSQNAADAIIINASAGGIDMTAAGAAGEDIDIVCTSGSVNISGGENVANAVVISAGAGGIDISATGAAGEDIDIVNTGGSVVVSATESANDAIKIEATTGGIDILASGAAAGEDIDIVATGSSVNISSTEDVASAILLHANAGTSETIKIHSDQGTGVASLDLVSDVGGISLTSGLASADAINLSASAGGVDVDGALQVNIASSQNAGDAVRINASAGGIDIDAAGAAGEDITIDNAAGSIVVTAAEAIADSIVLSSTNGGIDILCPGAGAGLDIDIVNTGGSIVLSATESANDAIKVEATAGGIDILASGAAAGEDIDIVATGSSVNISSSESASDSIKIESTAGGVDILASGAAAGEDIDIIATGSSVNITSTEAVAAAINLTASTGAGGITMTSGTGNITMSGTVEQLDAKLVIPTGFDININQSPVMTTAVNTGGAPTGATGDVNLMYLQEGILMEQFILGAGQTIIAPRMDATGLLISLDLVDNEGAEYNFGARANNRHAFTIGTSAAFFMEAKFVVADLSGVEPLIMGFRIVQANAADYTTYTDFYGLGLNNATSATNVAIFDQLNTGGVTIGDSGDAWTGGDGGTVTLKVLVSAAGVITATIDGSAPTTPVAMTFDNADVVMPFIHFLHDTTTPGNIHLVDMSVGFQ